MVEARTFAGAKRGIRSSVDGCPIMPPSPGGCDRSAPGLPVRIQSARIEDAVGIELAFHPLVVLGDHRLQWREGLGGSRCEAGGVATGLGDGVAQRLGVDLPLEPALIAGPVEQQLMWLDVGDVQARSVGRQADPPQRRAGVAEEGQRQLSELAPEVGLEGVPADRLAGGGHRACTAFETQMQGATVPGRCAQGERLASPFGQTTQSL